MLDEARKVDAGVADVAKALAVSRKLHQEAEQRLLHIVSPVKATSEDVELSESGWTSKLAAKIAASPPNPNAAFPELEKAVRHAAENPELALYKLKNTTYKFSFLLIPISLPFVWLMFFWKPGVTMYDHAVFVLYSLCFMSLLFVVLIPLAKIGLDWLVVLLVLLAPPVHMFVQLRGTYNLGKWGALWRTCMLLLVANIVLCVFVVLVLMMSVR